MLPGSLARGIRQQKSCGFGPIAPARPPRASSIGPSLLAVERRHFKLGLTISGVGLHNQLGPNVAVEVAGRGPAQIFAMPCACDQSACQRTSDIARRSHGAGLFVEMEHDNMARPVTIDIAEFVREFGRFQLLQPGPSTNGLSQITCPSRPDRRAR